MIFLWTFQQKTAIKFFKKSVKVATILSINRENKRFIAILFTLLFFVAFNPRSTSASTLYRSHTKVPHKAVYIMKLNWILSRRVFNHTLQTFTALQYYWCTDFINLKVIGSSTKCNRDQKGIISLWRQVYYLEYPQEYWQWRSENVCLTKIGLIDLFEVSYRTYQLGEN